MRLHTLEITAFGPFAGTVTIDFDHLGADGLFLLHGQTGAGKTSVLDAISFALYGAVPGARGDIKRLVSDHAAPDAVPKVTLEATLSGRRVRLTRTPEYLRPKRRGTGTTKQNATARLVWLDGRGANLTRLDEIGDEVNRLLGMSAAQFFQVVLLPQGEFAKFLRASTDERGILLERLFDTERFRTVEEWLQERRRESADRLERETGHVERIAARFAQAAGAPVCTDEDPVPWAEALVVQEQARSQQARQQLDRIRRDRVAAAADLGRLTGIERARERGRLARAALADLDAQSARHAELTLEVAAARRVAPIGSLLEAESGAVDDREQARGTADRARSRLAATPAGAAVADALPSDHRQAIRELEDHRQQWAALIGGLSKVLPLQSRRETLATDRNRDLATIERQSEVQREAAEALARIPDRITRIDEQLERDDLAAVEVGPLRHRLTAAGAAGEAAAEFARCTRRREAAEDHHTAARTAHQDAKQEWLEIRERRLDGMAAELAAELVPGDPCAVCGSVEHPQPAARARDFVGKDEEDAALRRERRADDALTAARDRLTEIDRRLSELAARSDGHESAYWAAEIDTLEAALRSATDAAARAEAARRQRAELDDRRRTLEATVAACREHVASARARVEAADATLIEIDEQLSDAAGTDGSVAARIDRHRELTTAAGNLRDALDRAATVERTVAEHRSRLATALADAGFESVDAARAARRDPADLVRLTGILDDARENRAIALQTLAQPEVASAEAELPVDLTSAKETDRKAADALERAISVRETSERRVTEMKELAAQLWSARDVLEPARAHHARIVGLADVVAGRGANSRRMSLRSYVLASRLEDVAIAATERFRVMSGGRYGFVHSDSAGPRGTRGGLGLEISDRYTGVVRSAATLSGGESFCASLALALGLADVVSAEAGGVTLDTMFIDEGFGSLDADALDSVMGVLDELRAGGRVVGVVSHVDEMRYRIPSRLHVLRERAGSRLEQIAG